MTTQLMSPIRSVSYGGGVQSTALLVLAAERRIDFPLFLMANVGDDSEHPDTLTYVRDVAMPYAADYGIEVMMLDRIKRDGTKETLWQRLTKEGSRSLLNERRAMLGKDPVYLTRFGVPLREAIDTDQELLPLADDGSCDSGWCFT